MVMQRNRKLWGSMSLALALSIALVGCSDNNGGNNGGSNAPSNAPSNNGSGEAAEQTKPVTLSAFISTPNQAPTADNRIYKKIKDELGVSLDMEFLVGDLQQKLGVMIAGGDYPDLITADTKLVAAGAVIPLEDLIEEHAPNLKKHYAKAWNKMKDSSDGHIYWLPNYGVVTGEPKFNSYSGPAFWVQKDVLKEAGYPTPKTLDDYMKLIRDYAAKHPQIDGQPTIGYTTLAFDWRTFPLLNAPEHLTGHPNDGGVVVDDGVASVFADKEMSKRYYKELNALYNEGLMDKEAFIQNYDQYLAKLSSGRVLGMFDQHWNFQPAEDTLVSQGKIGKTYVGFPLVYDTSIKDWYLEQPVPNLNNGFGISVDAKDPVRIIKFLDALMDEKYQKLLNWGEEGVDYMVGDGGKFYRTPEQRKQQEDPTWKLANRADAFLGALPKMEGTFSDGNATSAGLQPEEFYASLKPEDKELLDAYGHKTWTDFFSTPPENNVFYPAWQIDLIEGSEASIANKQMSDTSLKFLPKAITAKSAEFDAVWNEYVEAYKKINVKAYEDRINEQIQWRIKNWTSGE
ncbi:ABC transporter substrate-binding protein [Paenibacillus methanolicus]|uniref:Putative aldouronate transport system substrate-binding protein n=1 Tax=Paenibacillus methanolicus TaxID=582686 RepID=A0A5S5CEL0_9BACL|nr:ABC transporter substrate-binding protein [Paenibacillus methanolicus]TYP76780.1 putative aldouronate transport system substrate-binding protein [Paenibacillus methanolicus]